MTSYYNIFKNTEFIIQNTNTSETYKAIKQIYQSGGGDTMLIYEDTASNLKKTNTNTTDTTDKQFFNTCKQSRIQKFKQPKIQIGGFNIQL